MKNPNKKIVTSVGANGNLDYSSKLGINERFHKDDYDHVKNAILDFNHLNIKDIIISISLADYHSEGGEKWYKWLFEALSRHFNVLPSITLIEEPSGSSSVGDSQLYAGFINDLISEYGNYFEGIELLFEPETLMYQNNHLDSSRELLIEKIELAAEKAKTHGKRTILGGINSVGAEWLSIGNKYNVLKHFDVIGICHFPKVPDNNWNGWYSQIEKIQHILDQNQSKAEIWITETGYSTWKNDDANQILKFIEAFNTPVKKVFWSSLFDLSPSRAATDGFHSDERKYHFGLKSASGFPKLLFRMLEQKSPDQIQKEDLYISSTKNKPWREKGILITGGAGFIGTNVANRLLNQGERVIIYDNLSRPGVENNLKWLVDQYPQVEVIIADVRDKFSVEKAVNEAKHIFHFAAQVAVTSSIILPAHDYEVNVGGTFNVLEAIRLSPHKPSLIFTSTNKVYGDLPGLELESNGTRYFPVNPVLAKNGISENISLSFHSPYGCSKGSADQYIQDYARSFGLRTVVFRMSCIYGPHQFGTEDQGWVAHFINQALSNKIITLYGDGKQVRDILYVDDLVNAFLLAKQNIGELAGEAFNMGGGPENAVSLVELIDYLNSLDHLKINVEFDQWRIGDQKYYVSDTRKFRKRTGWRPHVSYMEGLIIIYSWLNQYHESKVHEKSIVH